MGKESLPIEHLCQPLCYAAPHPGVSSHGGATITACSRLEPGAAALAPQPPQTQLASKCRHPLTSTQHPTARPRRPLRASPSPPLSAGSNLVEQMNAVHSQQASAPVPTTISSKDPKAAAAAASDMNIVRRKLTGYVGFANLPNQWHRKSVRKGFNFNVMVVGAYTRALAGGIDVANMSLR
jgi:hypothetical protein